VALLVSKVVIAVLLIGVLVYAWRRHRSNLGEWSAIAGAIAAFLYVLVELYPLVIYGKDSIRVHARWIQSRSETYRLATRLFTENSGELIVISATEANPEGQNDLYAAILKKVSTDDTIVLHQVIAYSVDKDLKRTKRFLESLGERGNFKLTVIFERPGMPSAILGRDFALLGFNDYEGKLTEAIYISAPEPLARAISTHYLALIAGGVVVKDWQQDISQSHVPEAIAAVQRKLNRQRAR
jgi:hypothetical protein